MRSRANSITYQNFVTFDEKTRSTIKVVVTLSLVFLNQSYYIKRFSIWTIEKNSQNSSKMEWLILMNFYHNKEWYLILHYLGMDQKI